MRIGILGAGESGVGAALLASKLKYEVFVSDNGEISSRFRNELEKNNIPFEERGHTIDRLVRSDLVIKSPGIPETVKVVTDLRLQGVEVVSEIEFASRYCGGNILAITGSNGKTTTATLCDHLLRSASVDSALCGNVGLSFSRAVAERTCDWYVVEASSFQLEDIVRFRAHVSMLLNLTPDHLDRYGGSMENYADAKFRIVENALKEDLFIYNASDGYTSRRLKDGQVPVSSFAVEEGVQSNYELGEGLMGKHNAFNASCAIAAMEFIGLTREEIQLGLKTFERPKHRLEEVAVVEGVKYINDSKATNTDAAFYALDAQQQPVVWIAGGQDKGNDYSELLEVVRDKVKALICLGVDNVKLKLAFSAEVEIVKETMDVFEAVEMAASIANSGDVVLLSPACASFDLFDNYEHRGEMFRKAVGNVK